MSNRVYITWEEYDKAVEDLCGGLRKAGCSSPAAIVGVARGGLVAAVLVAHKKGYNSVPVYSVTTSTYKGTEQVNPDAPIRGYAPPVPRFADVLVIDDVEATGNTRKRVLGWLADVYAGQEVKITFATVFGKKESTSIKGRDLEEGVWIVFPYEREYT